MRQVAPTRPQKIMAFFMGMVVVGLLGFTYWEIKGILSPELEDTWSEFVFDWPTWANLTLGVASIIVAVFAAWSAIHYIVDRNASWRGSLTKGERHAQHD